MAKHKTSGKFRHDKGIKKKLTEGTCILNNAEWYRDELDLSRHTDFDEPYTQLRDRILCMKDFLTQKLIDHTNSAMKENLSDHQKTVLNLTYIQDKTYSEVAEKLKLNYTTIPHSLNGIYSPKHGKYHGGSIPKLRKKMSKDNLVAAILSDIQKLSCNDDDCVEIDQLEEKYKEEYKYEGF